MDFTGQNLNPVVFDTSANRRSNIPLEQEDDSIPDELDALEVFDLIRDIIDPEHPLTLEALNVLSLQNVSVDAKFGKVHVYFTPTVPHCSASTLIGLCIRVKLQRSLPSHFKVDVEITPGMHLQEEQVNKQLSDKERVAAALENDHLLSVVHKCLSVSMAKCAQLVSSVYKLIIIKAKQSECGFATFSKRFSTADETEGEGNDDGNVHIG